MFKVWMMDVLPQVINNVISVFNIFNIISPSLLCMLWSSIQSQLQSLLFKAQVANVSLVYLDYAVVLLEEMLLFSFSSRLQTFHEQALSPANDYTYNRLEIKQSKKIICISKVISSIQNINLILLSRTNLLHHWLELLLYGLDIYD